MKIEAFGKGNRHVVEALEKKMNILLPTDYKDFLVEYNGAKKENSYFRIDDLNQSIMFNLFFGVNLDKRSLNLEFWHREFGDDIPSKSLLIGNDHGGGFILLINNDQHNGIYYYDHSYFFDESSDENNTYFISETFTKFLNKLRNDQP